MDTIFEDVGYTDEVGGHHDSGIGWSPDHTWCGECTNSTCKTCAIWEYTCVSNNNNSKIHKPWNKNIRQRDRLIFPNGYQPDEYIGGVRYYTGLSVDILEVLLNEGYADPEEYQNNAPTILSIYKFLQKYPEYTAHGYVVDLPRGDYRVSIEGVEKGSPADSEEELKDFKELFSNTDSYNENTMYCWYD